jgi:hypothetical protein
MKRALLLPIFMGLVFYCATATAIPVAPQAFPWEQVNTDILSQILSEAVALFQSEYGIETSVEALKSGYNDGSVTIELTEAQDGWRVGMGGGVVVVVSDDSF